MNDTEKRLQATIESAYKACVEMWKKESSDAAAVFQIDIPPQHLTVSSGATAHDVLQTLRGVGVHGTYRVKTEHNNERKNNGYTGTDQRAKKS